MEPSVWYFSGGHLGLVSLNQETARVDEYDCPEQTRKAGTSQGAIGSIVEWTNQAAIDYIRHQVMARNREKWQELLTYLDKHQHEIVHYEQRQKAGKPIGSGRVEKAVDQVIGHRQKHKGSSWRPQGSRALGLLKVLELNGQWQQFWFSQQLT